jgi:phage-related minor tail protein
MPGNVKGIYIEFRGDTTKLDKALREVRNSTKDIDKELKQVDKALKFNPS